MSLQTEQTAREREATKPLPFEESIVLAIYHARGVALSLRDYTNVLDHIEAQQKTAEARKQARADENLR